VQKFAPTDDHVVSVHVKAAREAPEPTPEKPVEQHQSVLSAPVEKRLAAHAATRVAPPDQTAKQLKEALLREQMDSPIVNKKPAKTRRKFRASTIVATACALVILGGYLAYVNMPSISVRVAASRAGVDAKYPGYNPGGYRLDGPVAYAPGQVTINYRANGADWKYSLTQTNSTWDSTAVLENRVTPETNDYETLNQKGLTIYRFNNKAAWVNGGVLYTIDGDAALSNDQVLRIVDSI
jgi:hypothetical protein